MTAEAVAPATHNAPPLKPVGHEILATWPEGTFLENLLLLPDGDFVVSVHSEKRLLRLTRSGKHATLADLPASPCGLVLGDDGGLYVVAGEPGQGPHHLYRVSLDGRVVERAAIADTLFLNGFTPGRRGFGYAVD
ncbi:MAG: hypothetical protein ACLP01_08390 [Solirubrobacteraceae bacterium]